MVELPTVRQAVREQLAEIAFEGIHQDIRERIEQMAAVSGNPSWADLIDQFAGLETQKTVSAIMFAEYEKWGTEPERLVEDCVNALRYDYLQRQITEHKERMKQADASAQPALVEELLRLNEQAIALKHKRSNLLTANKPTPQDI